MTRDWLAAHVFYNGIQSKLLLDGIVPLIEELRARQLIRHYFFIRYWERGFHIRLRLLPAPDVSHADLRAIVDPGLEGYLAACPSLYPNTDTHMAPYYTTLFEMEYGKEELQRRYGEDGRIPYYPNNSVQYIPYEPEYARYGGPAGIELAERHFEASSDIVLRLLRELNIRVPGIVLGQAAQMMLQMAHVFFGDEARCAKYFGDYGRYWESLSGPGQQDPVKRGEKLEATYQSLRTRLHTRFDQVRTLIDVEQRAESDTGTRWLHHVIWLREQLMELKAHGRLELPERIVGAGFEFEYLLSGYLHMTNNRLGVRISDEALLGYLLHRSLSREDAPPTWEPITGRAAAAV
jgi:thiopeptide-type bacteriocin biosynthesis protein